MNLHWLPICVLAAIACAGCSSPKSKTQSAPLSFSEPEIRSKTWNDSNGQSLQLLEWSVIDLKSKGELLVAKYGNTNTGFVTCLDFYRVVSMGKGPKDTVSSIASALLTPSGNSGEITERRAFDFLAHDIGREAVKSIKIDGGEDPVLITITRETMPGASEKRVGLRYVLRYEKDCRIEPDLHVGVWEIAQ